MNQQEWLTHEQFFAYWQKKALVTLCSDCIVGFFKCSWHVCVHLQNKNLNTLEFETSFQTHGWKTVMYFYPRLNAQTRISNGIHQLSFKVMAIKTITTNFLSPPRKGGAGAGVGVGEGIIKLRKWMNQSNTIILPLFNWGITAHSIMRLTPLFPSIVDVEHNWTRTEPPLKTPTD